MSRKKEIKPLVDVMHDYKDALQNVHNESSMLYSAVHSIVTMKEVGIPEKVLEILRERCDAYRKAMYGDN